MDELISFLLTLPPLWRWYYEENPSVSRRQQSSSPRLRRSHSAESFTEISKLNPAANFTIPARHSQLQRRPGPQPPQKQQSVSLIAALRTSLVPEAKGRAWSTMRTSTECVSTSPYLLVRHVHIS